MIPTQSEGRNSARACVSLPDGTAELRTLPMAACRHDDGWLRVDASAICGTDVSLASGDLKKPTILGHHVIGRVEAVGETAAEGWSVVPGDRIAVEEYLPCWSCRWCRTGLYRLCPATDLWSEGRRVGLVPVEERPFLWGGNAQYLYLPANAVVHRVSDDVSAELAVWTLPLANAIDWVSRVGRTAAGENVVVLGPGYHGLAAVAAAQDAGAGRVIVAGTAQDEARIRLAEKMGAVGAAVSGVGLAERIHELTDGGMANLVLDTTGGGPEAVGTALSLLNPTGRLVVAGIKQPPVASLDTSVLLRGMHAVIGVRGRDPISVGSALDLLARGGAGLAAVPTCDVPLSDVGDMLTRLASRQGPDTPHVVVRPWLDSDDPTDRRS